jgi:hypothetical protein
LRDQLIGMPEVRRHDSSEVRRREDHQVDQAFEERDVFVEPPRNGSRECGYGRR